MPITSTLQKSLQAEARALLTSALSSTPGPKALLIDPNLYNLRLQTATPLSLFTDNLYLSTISIHHIAPLSPSPISPPTQPSIHILIRGPNARAARHAVSFILSLRSVPTPSQIHIHTIPRPSPLIHKILHSTNLIDIPVTPLPLPFLPFDNDLLTLDWSPAYRQVVLDGDDSSLLAASSALVHLARLLNLQFHTVRTAGPAAAAVAEHLLDELGPLHSSDPDDSGRISPTDPISSIAKAFFSATEHARTNPTSGPFPTPQSNPTTKPQPTTLVIIDRGVDLVTPLLTQWTYEGLLEESIYLHNNTLDLPISTLRSEDARSLLSSSPSPSGPTVGTVRKTLRCDVDPIFAELRDQNYWTALRHIGTHASQVRAYYEKRPVRETAEISQVREYVRGLKDVKSEHWAAAAHTAIAAEISARTFDSYEFKRRFELEREMIEGSTATGRRVYITDAVARGETLEHVLRLCCLWSLTSSGIDSEEFDFVRREILAIFGLKTLPLLANLERTGMLVRSAREQQTSNLSWIPFPNFGGGGSDAGSTTGSVVSSAAGSDESRRYRSSRAAAEYSWQFARAALRLVTDFDPDKPVTEGTVGAIAAPYSGYTPLSVRLVEAGLSDGGWEALPRIVAHTALLPPGHDTVEQRKGTVRRSLKEGGEGEGFDAVIVFVGGITRAEASAVRMAAKSKGVRALIATTAVVGPDAFVRSFGDDVMEGENL